MDLYKKDPEYVMFTARFISVDDRGFKVLNESLGNVLDKDDFEKGEIAVAAKTFTEDDTLADTLYLLKTEGRMYVWKHLRTIGILAHTHKRRHLYEMDHGKLSAGI